MEQPVIEQDSAAAPKVAAPEQDATPEIELDEELVGDDQQAETDDDIEDELEGVKLSGKKAAVLRLRNERLMQADYTRKRQAAIAEAEAEKRTLATQRANIEQAGKLVQAHLSTVAKLVALDEQIAAGQQVDWDGLIDSDPVKALKLERHYRGLTEKRQLELQNLTALQQQHALEEQRKTDETSQSRAKQIEQAAETLRREVPNWTQRDEQLRQYVVAQGIPADNVAELVIQAPSLGKIFHKAELYDQLVAKQKAKTAPEPQAEPVKQITSSRATATKDPSRMSDAEFAAWRKRQIAQRGS